MDYWLENVFSDETCKEFYDDYWIFGEGDASGDGNTEEYDEATDEGSGSGSGDEGKNLKVKRWKIDNFCKLLTIQCPAFVSGQSLNLSRDCCRGWKTAFYSAVLK